MIQQIKIERAEKRFRTSFWQNLERARLTAIKKDLELLNDSLKDKYLEALRQIRYKENFTISEIKDLLSIFMKCRTNGLNKDSLDHLIELLEYLKQYLIQTQKEILQITINFITI
jgi:hypothetical protein